MSRARALGGPAGIGFTPTDLAAVTGWYRLSQRTDTGTLTIPDALGGPSYTQSTAAQKPTFSTSNGFATAVFDATDDNLLFNLDSDSTNSSPQHGIAFWTKPTDSSTEIYPYHIINTGVGASLNSIIWVRENTTGLGMYVYVTNNFTGRTGQIAGALTLDQWHFVTFEFDGGQSAEVDEAIITVDNVKQTLTFSDFAGTPGDMPDVLRQGTGTGAMGSDGTPYDGMGAEIGANYYLLGGAGGISGGGLLTSAQRQQLMDYQPPQ